MAHAACADCVVPGVGALRRTLAWVRGSLHNRAVVAHLRALRVAALMSGAAQSVRAVHAARAGGGWCVRLQGCALLCVLWPGARVRARCQLAGGVRALRVAWRVIFISSSIGTMVHFIYYMN